MSVAGGPSPSAVTLDGDRTVGMLFTGDSNNTNFFNIVSGTPANSSLKFDNGKFGFTRQEKFGRKTAGRRIFGLGFHLLGDTHALEQFGEIDAAGAARGRLAIGDRLCFQ